MSTTALRPLSLGELLDRSFSLYRANFLALVAMVALPQLPVLAITLLLLPMIRFGEFTSSLILAAIQFPFALIAFACWQQATALAASRAHLGMPVGLLEIYKAIARDILPMTLKLAALVICVSVGAILCVVPGVILWLRWSLFVPISVLERKRFKEARARSVDLTEGSFGQILLIGVLILVCLYIAGIVCAIPMLAAMLSQGLVVTTVPTWAVMLNAVGSYLSQCLVYPLLNVAMTVVYYDLRVRKEAFDLHHMMSSMDQPSSSAGSAH